MILSLFSFAASGCFPFTLLAGTGLGDDSPGFTGLRTFFWTWDAGTGSPSPSSFFLALAFAFALDLAEAAVELDFFPCKLSETSSGVA